ncbi:hypothetical protein WBP07_01665 [Novosphingobium sp. BL-8A]|uniref:hypothetical protein n=1 Tax=Novosphingobium sp. BL-8A TaxID=3127639 RepID=UPI003757EA0E
MDRYAGFKQHRRRHAVGASSSSLQAFAVRVQYEAGSIRTYRGFIDGIDFISAVWGNHFRLYILRILVFFALSMVMTFFEGDKVTMSAGNNATIFALFFLSPIGGHAFGTRHADEELESLIEFVARNAQTAL